MTKTTWWVATSALLLLCAACDKKPAPDPAADKTEKAEKAGDKLAGSGSASAKFDPWDAPPPGADSKIGANVGDDFAKIDVAPPAKGNVMRLVDKIDVAKLEKQAEEKVSLKGFGSAESSGFKVTYNPSQNATHEKYRAVFEQNKVFEKVAEGLNKTIRIPHAIDINTVSCNTINAFYDPNNKRIIMCYELVDYFLGVFKPKAKNETELGNAVMGATIFSFFHETGHGLIHVLELPAVGREEDSADQLATLILIAAGDEGVSMALSGAYWFQLQSESDRKMPFWDEHAFDGQRFYNILCMIYGSDPVKYANFVSAGTLPKDRAARCPEEYNKLNKAWEKLLQPHLTNGAAINIDYKPTVPVAEAPKTTTEDSDPWGEAPAGGDTIAEPAKPSTDLAAAVAKLTELTDKMCRCRDNDCAQAVVLELTKWAETVDKNMGSKNDPTLVAIGKRLGECMQFAMGGGTGTPPAAPAKPAPRPKPPAPKGVTCEQVARKAAQLIGAEAEARARSMSAEEVEALKAKLESELPAAIEQILAQCAKENWSETSRRCVINAKNLEQATKCN
jgi:hypothetical protein